MPRNKEDLRILLLQIRHHTRTRAEEHESFASYSDLAKSQIDILNVFDTPVFSLDIIQGYDALFVGGASEASVLEPETYPFVSRAQELLLYCIEKNIPVFASCFGFQLAVKALGGDIIHEDKDFEMGTIPIRLTEAAAEDPLFHDTPDGFLAVAVHQQKSLQTPKECTLLAYTEACGHSFRVNGKLFWGFQFHPEVDKQRLIERLTVFKEKYTENDSHLESVLAHAAETPESNRLVKKFVQRVLLNS
ncbi:MAG: type 1 glutamine amidotransferase [SAR324 cluster bacterium]|nr:type 1 glutamine amidotransferase [SAR324 cluster bacterium]